MITPRNEPGLPSQIKLHVEDDVVRDLLEVGRHRFVVAHRPERFIVINLTKFFCNRFGPETVSIFGVQEICFPC